MTDEIGSVPTHPSDPGGLGDPGDPGRHEPGDEQEQQYVVVRNHEEQYSIWAADREPPAGWDSMGVTGSRDDCLHHIDEVWTDIRPLSLRRALAQQDLPRG